MTTTGGGWLCLDTCKLSESVWIRLLGGRVSKQVGSEVICIELALDFCC